MLMLEHIFVNQDNTFNKDYWCDILIERWINIYALYMFIYAFLA